MVLNEFDTFCRGFKAEHVQETSKMCHCFKKAWKTMISGTVSLNSTTDRAANWDLNMFTMMNT